MVQGMKITLFSNTYFFNSFPITDRHFRLSVFALLYVSRYHYTISEKVLNLQIKTQQKQAIAFVRRMICKIV